MNPFVRRPDAATLAIAAVVAFLVMLAALHALRRDVDPSWHFISEYEIGRHGWVMRLAFLVLAAANLAVMAAVRPAVGGIAGSIGLALFFVGTVGTVLAGLFVSDAITTTPAMASPSGRMHNLGGSLGLAGIVGTWILSAALLRAESWRPARLSVAIATAIVTLGFLVAFVSIATLAARSGGVFGPDVPVGWPNRVGILSGCVWLVIVARDARRLGQRSHAA
ncbi:MAG: DUF998 domain-containing protein [Planctomycetaceae bacterium]